MAIRFPWMRKRYWLLVGTLMLLMLAYAGYGMFWPQKPDPRVLPADAVDESVIYSNILPADYVGPDTCKKCHPSQYGRWRHHPHSKMNQMADAGSVQGKFDNACLHLPTGQTCFYTEDGQYYMEVRKHGQRLRRYQVTRTVGSRYMQFYIGKQLEGPDPENDPIYKEHMLPFSYWFKIKRWLPRQYFDNDGDEHLAHGVPQIEALDRRPDVRLYTHVCMNCHTTYPYVYRMFQGMRVGFPDATVAAAVQPLSKELDPAIYAEPTAHGFGTSHERLDPERHLVSLGISCESCHFGGREHALYQEKKIRFLPTSKYLRISEEDPQQKPLTSSRYNPTTVNGICAQCHSGNGKLYPNGAGIANSREGLDMHKGFCTTKMRCVSCHEPHTASREPSGGLTDPRHLSLCVKCHDQYSDSQKAFAHAKHPVGAKVDCMDCHMPRYTQGLDDLIRTHRVCHPVEKVMVKEGSANACNLCHLDKSLRWTLTELERGWGKKIEPQSDWPIYSKLDQPVGQYWLKGKNNHLRLVAVQCYARSPLGKHMLADVIRSLNDPEPVNRVFHGAALRRLLGRAPDAPLEVEITETPAVRTRQIGALLQKMGLHGR